MSQTSLTWKYLPPEMVHRCLAAPSLEDIYAALLDADAKARETADGSPFLDTKYLRTAAKGGDAASSAGPVTTHSVVYVQPHSDSQQQVLLDLFAHLILFCRERNFSPEKTSATFGIVAATHAASMTDLMTLQDSFTIFGQLLQCHAVHRPPFSTSVLTVEDAKVITDYLLKSYYRHYKLYLYAFTPRRTATVRSYVVGEADVPQPPVASIPPQSAAINLSKYEAEKHEVQAALQAKVDAVEREERAKEEAELAREREEAARIPPIPQGLQAQLASIRTNVAALSLTKLEQLEGKLDTIENRIAESQQSAAQQQAQQAQNVGGKKGGVTASTLRGSPKNTRH